jgi:Domain of unknown function (DUF427)
VSALIINRAWAAGRVLPLVARHEPARRSPAAHRLPVPGLSGTVRFDWAALDTWFEGEQVFEPHRNRYVPVDALRSTRPVRVELDGIVLAESPLPVMVFETGLPTRYYLNPTEINFEHLTPSDTVTACPSRELRADTGRSASGHRAPRPRLGL